MRTLVVTFSALVLGMRKARAFRYGLPLASVVALTGCANVQPSKQSDPVIERSAVEERRTEKTYAIGKELLGYAGEAILVKREYNVRSVTSSGALFSDRDFTVNFPPFGHTARVPAHTPIPTTGTTERDGIKYSLVRVPGGIGPVALLVDPSGRFEGSGVNVAMGGARMGYTYRVTPADIELKREVTTTSQGSDGSLRFEIAFLGGSRDWVKLRYQAFESAGAHATASEEKVVKLEGQILRFAFATMRVLEADHERIRYIVLDDNLSTK